MSPSPDLPSSPRRLFEPSPKSFFEAAPAQLPSPESPERGVGAISPVGIGAIYPAGAGGLGAAGGDAEAGGGDGGNVQQLPCPISPRVEELSQESQECNASSPLHVGGGAGAVPPRKDVALQEEGVATEGVTSEGVVTEEEPLHAQLLSSVLKGVATPLNKGVASPAAGSPHVGLAPDPPASPTSPAPTLPATPKRFLP